MLEKQTIMRLGFGVDFNEGVYLPVETVLICTVIFSNRLYG